MPTRSCTPSQSRIARTEVFRVRKSCDPTRATVASNAIPSPERSKIWSVARERPCSEKMRRVHEAFGEALREEQVSRELDSLDH